MNTRVRRALRSVVPLRIRRPVGIAAYESLTLVREASGRLRPEILGRIPILAVRDRVYDDRYYERADDDTAALYERLVDALARLRSPRTVVDVGCGSGLMLAQFAEHGADVRGVDGSSAAIRRSALSDRIVRAHLERGVPNLGRFDLCLCIEVAEHLRRGSARRLVDGVTRLSDLVVFTAAPPGQPGTAHMNAQPKTYWSELFARHGFSRSGLEDQLLEEIADIPEPYYIHANLMVFEKR